MSDPHFPEPISYQIWDKKYRLRDENKQPLEADVTQTWRRIAKALAEAEKPADQPMYEAMFYNALSGFKFLPAGRITAGAGTGRAVTLFNCLAGETLIPTVEYGIVPISEIAGETVHVLDMNGQWVAAPINSFGSQPVASVVLAGGYNGQMKKTIRATAGHRWILQDGTEATTNQLRKGTSLLTVKRGDVDCSSQNYRRGVIHGLVFGDGSFERTDSEGLNTFRIRLCGAKAELLPFFNDEHISVTRPPSYSGDPLVRITGVRINLKALPSEGRDIEYLTGFLRGWFAADGAVCKRDHRPILSCGKGGVDWLRQFGAVAGMEVAYATKLSDETNYGQRGQPTFNVSFHRWTITSDDLLRQKHRKAFGVRPDYGWTVESVGPYGDPEPVFCPRVVTTDSVQLDLGIHTGQCFVMGTVPDSMGGIFDMLREAALTMQQGGGIGYDFSTLRPKGSLVKGVAADASGPLTFMDCWDAMCRTVMSAGSRRGAMMATMRCDHPDIEAFIEAKRDPLKLRMFNLSVLVTDDFMAAVKADADWRLHFENRAGETLAEKTIKARDLWDKIMRSTYNFAEPGVIFIDRINAANNLKYMEKIASTNPCLHPDSMIETVHGRVRIADIKEPTQVYTMLADGSLGIRPASAAFVSKRNARVIDIGTRNGKSITLTPDHRVLVHRGQGVEWVEAQNLVIGDRLVQLCRGRRGTAYSGVKLTTEDNRSYRMEHRMIAEAVYGPLSDEDDVHHIDGDTYSNFADNLEVLSHGNHATYTATFDNPQTHQIHRSDGTFKATGVSPKTIIPMPEELRSRNKSAGHTAVSSICDRGETTDVYDLTVYDTHNFIADFTVVHNCGEQPLPPYGACLLGSINLPTFVKKAFQTGAGIDRQELENLVTVAVRMMDNVVDVSNFPLPQQEAEAKLKRRIGLGVTGLADALIMCGLTYGSDEAAQKTELWMALIDNAAYRASIKLAEEKGSFPGFDVDGVLAEGTHASTLPRDIQDGIRKHGLRNALLTSIAPTGTISLYAGNVSSGVEPVFAYSYTRKVLNDDGSKREEAVEDFAYRAYRKYWEANLDPMKGEGEGWDDSYLPPYFVSAQTLDPMAHVRMQAAAQKHVDSSISKTINCPVDISFEDFCEVYMAAWDAGCKGCTTYRPNDVTGSILSVTEAPASADLARPCAEGMEPVSVEVPPLFPETVLTIKRLPEEAPTERPEELDGTTYKLKWPGSNHSLYITITDIEEGGEVRPFEVFINSKNMEHFAWTVALTRMISAVFRRPHDSSFVVEELKAVFDPKGGAWMNGKFVPSILAAIGGVIEKHMRAIGYIKDPELDKLAQTQRDVLRKVWEESAPAIGYTDRPVMRDEGGHEVEAPNAPGGKVAEPRRVAMSPLLAAPYGQQPAPPMCGACHSSNVKKEAGCFVCKDCGNSNCG